MSPLDEPVTLGEIVRSVARIEADSRTIEAKLEAIDNASRQRTHELASSITAVTLKQGEQSGKLDGIKNDLERIEAGLKEDVKDLKDKADTNRQIALGLVGTFIVATLLAILQVVTRG